MGNKIFKVVIALALPLYLIIRYFIGTNNIKNTEFEGIICSKKRSYNMHIHYIGVSGYKDAFEMNNSDFFNYADTGDYIIKKKNSLWFYLVKGKDTFTFKTY